LPICCTGAAPVRCVAGRLDLDQFVRIETAFDFLQYGSGQPLVADHDHRLAVVGQALEELPLGGREWFHCIFLKLSADCSR
jgi:hypothetical protein